MLLFSPGFDECMYRHTWSLPHFRGKSTSKQWTHRPSFTQITATLYFSHHETCMYNLIPFLELYSLVAHCLNLTLYLFPYFLIFQMAFRLGSNTHLDERCFAMQQFKVMPLSLVMLSIYPKMYPIHDLSDEVSIVRNRRSSKHSQFPQAPIF